MHRKKGFYLMDRIFLVFLLMVILLMTLFFCFVPFALKQGTYLLVFLFAFLLATVFYVTYRWIYIPYQESNKTLRLFADGYIFKGVFDLRIHFNHELFLAMQKFREIIDTKELIEGSKKHAEYLALQNQINPHFLYNTLEGIRSEALIEGVEIIANMTEALETFFRYTISDMDKLATLEEEIVNVETYCTIQRFRFGEKIEFKIESPEDHDPEIFHAKIPKLTLQPIVENAVFHGIEPKMGKGLVTLKVLATPSRLLITVSDNGVGMAEEHVHRLNDQLRGASLTYIKKDKETGGIALLNVNNRIKLLFGDEYGMYLYSKAGAGTDVEISLPLIL
mgnify:FL=1|jgi:two-component system sensor histidine kinase YesM